MDVIADGCNYRCNRDMVGSEIPELCVSFGAHNFPANQTNRNALHARKAV